MGRLLGPSAAALLVLVSACASGRAVDKARATLAAVERSEAALADAFKAWDLEHQQALVHSAPDEATATKAIRDYRARRESVLGAFVAARQASLLGEAVIALADQGQRGEKDLSVWLVSLFEAQERLRAALEGLGVWNK